MGCGLSKDLDGVWRVKQLSEAPQDIVQRCPENFAGQIPVLVNRSAADEI